MPIPLIYEYREYIDAVLADSQTYSFLSLNPHLAAVEYLLRSPDIIEWRMFSMNANSKAVEYQ